MEQLHVTPFSHLTDEEFRRHLLSKEEPTAEDVEAALRLELLMDSYSALLEQIHTDAKEGLGDSNQSRNALHRIRDLTEPARPKEAALN